MKRVLMMISLACFGFVATACEDKKEPTPPVASSTATASVTAAPMATPTATVAAVPSSMKQADSDEPDESEEETATGDISADNFEKELDGMEKEVSGKY